MKLLTLNTWNEQDQWKDRWQIVFRGLEKYQPDIVAFQEFINPEWAKIVSAKGGCPHYVFPNDQSGLMIMSKFPVVDWNTYVFKKQAPYEEYSRSFMVVNLECEGKQVAVLNTHLSWRLDDSDIRQAQAAEILDYLEETYKDQAVIAMGDYNAPSETPEINLIRDRGKFEDAYLKLYPQELGYTWSNQNGYAVKEQLPERRLDYIFTRQCKDVFAELEKVEIVFRDPAQGNIFASDHFGVYAKYGELKQ